MIDDPYAVLAELVEIVGSYCLGMLTNADEAKYARAIALVKAHRAGTDDVCLCRFGSPRPGCSVCEAPHPDLIDADGDRWVWETREGYCCNDTLWFYSRDQIEQQWGGPVTEAGPVETEGRKAVSELARDLASVLNRHSVEHLCGNTPHWVLAEYLIDCLESYGHAVAKRDRWYGISPSPGAHSLPASPGGPENTTDDREREG